ncbi:MAG: sigma-E processing peptidase SpoIIGA [Clostridia bacterium]|nr:sigma-E processing peptidase SpoIIGA [Clostridia bacterium]
MVVYADVLFAINFSMDFVSIFICGILLHKKMKKLRLFLASVVGGVYGTFIIFMNLNPLLDCFVLILVATFICYIAYYDKKIKRLIISLIIYLLTSCILGGIMNALYSLLNRVLTKYMVDQTFESVYSGARFFIIVSITIMVAMLFSKVLVRKKNVSEVNLEIVYKGEKHNVIALTDSGNMLVEPITGKSVILISERCNLSKKIDLKSEKNLRYIPYSDITIDGILKGIIPEKIIVNDNSVDAIIAPVNKESFGEYDAIVPISLV